MKELKERTVAPVLLELGDNIAEKAKLIYGQKGISALHKDGSLVFDLDWRDVKSVHIVKNKSTLGTVHFILVLVFIRGIISALFFPQIVMHLFKRQTTKWCGYLAIVTFEQETIFVTPHGWFRVGFHIQEPKTLEKNIKMFSPKTLVEVMEYTER